MPAELRPDWARARAEVFDQIRAARVARDGLALERALKWHLALHDILLRGPRRGTRGSSRAAGHLAARFQAWRDGRRDLLIQWWRDDRARGWRRAHRESNFFNSYRTQAPGRSLANESPLRPPPIGYEERTCALLRVAFMDLGPPPLLERHLPRYGEGWGRRFVRVSWAALPIAFVWIRV